MELESVKSSWAITILRLCLTTIIAGSILWSTFEDSYPNCSGIWLSSFFPFRHSQNDNSMVYPIFWQINTSPLDFHWIRGASSNFRGRECCIDLWNLWKLASPMNAILHCFRKDNTQELSEFIACLACCCFTSHSHWYARHLCQCLVTRGRLRAVSTLQFGVNT